MEEVELTFCISVRGRSKSVGRGRFLTTDRPVDFDQPTVKTTVLRPIFLQISRNVTSKKSIIKPIFAQIRYVNHISLEY